MQENLRQAGLGQDPGYGGVMHPQLLGDRADRPFLNMVIAQDLRLELRGNGHDDVLFAGSKDLGSVAESRGAQTPNKDGDKDGRAIGVGPRVPLASPSLPRCRTALPGVGPVVNPDASLYFFAPGIDGRVQHV